MSTVCAYGFDEIASTAITDDSGNGLTGTAVGWTGVPNTGASVSGHASALLFAGSSSQRIEVPNNSANALNLSNFTIMAWVFMNYSTDPDPDSQRNEICEKSGCYWFNIRWDTSPLHLLRVGGYFGSGPTAVDTFTGVTPIAPQVWTHIAATYDGANLTTFINGVQDQQLAETGALAQGATVTGVDENLVVGAKHRAGTGGSTALAGFFNGRMDDFRLLNTALNATQIAALMAVPVSGAPVVTITNPTQNENFAASTTSVQIRATAVPVATTVTSVTVTVNGGSPLTMNVDTNTPNGYKKAVGVQAGSNTAVVSVLDSSGFTTTATVSFNVSSGAISPTVNILSPAPDGTVITTASTGVQADCESAVGINPALTQVSTDGVNWTVMDPPVGGSDFNG